LRLALHLGCVFTRTGTFPVGFRPLVCSDQTPATMTTVALGEATDGHYSP